MSIVYPITSGGGASGNATQIQGRTVSSGVPKNGSTFVWFEDESSYNLDNSTNFIVFAGSASYADTSQKVLTKFKLQGAFGQEAPNQTAFFALQADIDNPYTGSINISSSEGETIYQLSSSNFSFLFQAPLTGSNIYTVYASSSNASSNFCVYNLTTIYNIS
jgi:hypothetical protein